LATHQNLSRVSSDSPSELGCEVRKHHSRDLLRQSTGVAPRLHVFGVVLWAADLPCKEFQRVRFSTAPTKFEPFDFRRGPKVQPCQMGSTPICITKTVARFSSDAAGEMSATAWEARARESDGFRPSCGRIKYFGPVAECIRTGLSNQRPRDCEFKSHQGYQTKPCEPAPKIARSIRKVC
jgi:hypothetical protein